jgi:hypothetical protein
MTILVNLISRVLGNCPRLVTMRTFRDLDRR